MNWTRKVHLAHAVIRSAIAQYKPVAVYALFSGGHDSMTTTHVASSFSDWNTRNVMESFWYPPFQVGHINTGIGVPETRAYVREVCRDRGWLLRIVRAKEDCGQDYREIVREFGFPGPGWHCKMYQRLKERGLRYFVRESKVGKPRRSTVMFISGARSEESDRRMGNVNPIEKEKDRSILWVAPIHDWTKVDCNRYMADHGLPRNPVVDKIHKSGECLCGAYAKKGELDELRYWYPKTAEQIDDIAAEAKAAGHDWGWEDRPPRKVRRSRKVEKNPLCMGCPSGQEKNDGL